jgi:hypothetical protein
MRHRHLARVPAVLLVILVGGVGTLAGCSSDDDPPSDNGSAAADPTPPPASEGATDAGTEPTADPNSPFVVAASAVAARSRDQVTQLHAMGLGTTNQSSLPQEQIPALAEAISVELGSQIQAATVMTPPKKSPAADLVAALDSYRALSKELAKWKPAAQKPLPDSWFESLEQTDDGWKESLGALSELSGEDLLADLPPLVMPGTA